MIFLKQKQKRFIRLYIYGYIVEIYTIQTLIQSPVTLFR